MSQNAQTLLTHCAGGSAPAHATRVSAVAAALSLLLFPAVAADSMRVGAYDFSYSATGDATARPIQVFDDGKNTFMQFRPGMAVPAIFSSSAGAPQLLVPSQEGPYIKLASIHGSLLLQMGRARAQVIHAGGGRADSPELTVSTPAGREPYVPGSPYPQGAQLVASISPVPMNMNGAPAVVDDRVQTNSYATPRKGDAMTWQEQSQSTKVEKEVWFSSGSASLSPGARNYVAGLAKLVPAGGRVVVIGREDDSFKEGVESARAKLIKDLLVKAGVPAEKITVRLGVEGKKDGKLWASTVVIESDGGAAPARASNAVLDNLQSLVRMNVLRLDQAEAIARNHGLSLGAGTAPQPAATTAASSTAPTAMGAPARPAAPVSKPWEMRKSDGTVEKMFARWAGESGWTVVWRDAPSIPITGDMPMPASDFVTAADTVIRRAQEVGYRISAAAYTNQTLVVSPQK